MFQNPVIFPAVSTRQRWTQILGIYDDDTGDPLTLTDDDDEALYTFTLEIIEQQRVPYGNDSGYGAPATLGQYAGPNPVITKTLGDGIEITDTGTIEIVVDKPDLQTLIPGTYDVFLTIADASDTDDCQQVLIGRLPVLYGGRNT